MRNVIAFFMGVLISFIVGLSGYWLYYNARYQVVYVQSMPFIHDKWTDTLKAAGPVPVGKDTNIRPGIAREPGK